MTTRTETALSEAVERVIPALDHWPAGPVHGAGWNRDTEPHSRACPPCVLLAALTAERAARGRVEAALWKCGVESGMDTNGDDGPGAMIAGMGVDGFADAMVREVRQLRFDYNECLTPSTTTPEAQKALAIAEYERLVESEESN